MARRQQHSGWRRWLSSRLALCLLVLVGLLLGRAVWQTWQKSRAVIDSRTKAERELGALAARQAKLEQELSVLKTDSGLEEKIREKFGVVKEGERVISIVATSGLATSTASSTKAWWEFWRD